MNRYRHRAGDVDSQSQHSPRRHRLFIIEAVPAVLLSAVVFFYLTDRPSEAAWLEPAQREWLAGRLEEERRSTEAVSHFTLGERCATRA